MAATALINVMTSAARKAARSLVRDFGEVEHLQVSIKGPANFVSAADHKAEDILFKELNKARPQYGFLMEEGGVVEGADKIAPLDHRSARRHHQLPARHPDVRHLHRLWSATASSSPALIYNPVADELFTAEKGKGAFLNDKRRLRVAARRTWATPWWPPAFPIAAGRAIRASSANVHRHARGAPASAARARPRSTSPGRRRAASTAIGNAT